MPVSEGKTHIIFHKYLQENVNWNEKNTFLDCGIGIGLIAKDIYITYILMNNIRDNDEIGKIFYKEKKIENINITGLEIYMDYIIYKKNYPKHEQIRYYFSQYGGNYHILYNSIIAGEKGDFNSYIEFCEINNIKYDYIIFGDSLEHITKEQGYKIIEKAKKIINKSIIIMLPIVDYEQDEVLGNIYEKHLAQWKINDLENIGFKFYGSGENTGCFIYERNI